MNHLNNCSPFNFDLSDSYSLNLTEQTYQFDSKQQPMHLGMSIQAVPPLFSVCNYDSQSENQQSNAEPLNLFHKYSISALTPTNPEDSFGSDIFGTQLPDLDEYLLSYSDNEHDNDAISSILNTPLTQQICSSGSETETGESTPASLSNPEDHLTDLPVGLSNLQNIQPAAADIPLNLYHTTSNNQPTEKVTVGNSSRIVQQKSFCKNIRDATERQKQRQRQRYQNDPDYAERKKKIPRERQRELRKNPAYMKRRRAQQMERYYNKLACAERKRKPDNNPASAERDRVRPKKMQTE